MTFDRNYQRIIEKLWDDAHGDHDDIDARLTIIEQTVRESEGSDAASLESGAHIHLTRAATQSIASGGETISWDTSSPVLTRLTFGDPGLPATQITIPYTGYYNIDVQAGWDTYDGGGTLKVRRVRDGATAVVWPSSEDPGLWTATDGQLFEGTAPMIPFQIGDLVEVFIDHDTGAAKDLASASLSVGLVHTGTRISQYATVVLQSQPVAWWRLDELSGTVAADSAGGFDMTYSGSPGLGAEGVMADGSGSPSVDFDGAKYAVGDDWSQMDFDSGAFSIEAWFNADALTGTTQIIIEKRRNATNYGWEVGVVSGGVFFVDDNASAVVSSGALTDGVTYHVVVTHDGATTTRLYLNGVLVDTDTGGVTISTNTEYVSIARDSAFGGYNFDGRIDEVAIYDRELTSSEIAEHYAVGSGG